MKEESHFIPTTIEHPPSVETRYCQRALWPPHHEPTAGSLILGRQKLIASKEKPGMALWREKLFAWMLKSSESAMEFFRLPTNRVIELGSRLEI